MTRYILHYVDQETNIKDSVVLHVASTPYIKVTLSQLKPWLEKNGWSGLRIRKIKDLYAYPYRRVKAISSEDIEWIISQKY